MLILPIDYLLLSSRRTPCQTDQTQAYTSEFCTFSPSKCTPFSCFSSISVHFPGPLYHIFLYYAYLYLFFRSPYLSMVQKPVEHSRSHRFIRHNLGSFRDGSVRLFPVCERSLQPVFLNPLVSWQERFALE